MNDFWTHNRAVGMAAVGTAGVVGTLLLWWSFRIARALRLATPACPRCAYNMSHLEKLECPECGHSVKELRDWTRRSWRWTPAALRTCAAPLLLYVAVMAWFVAGFAISRAHYALIPALRGLPADRFTFSDLRSWQIFHFDYGSRWFYPLTPGVWVERLTAIDLQGQEVNDTNLVEIASLEGLRKLNLDHTAVTDVGLAELRNVPVLESLSITGDFGDATIKLLVDIPGLEGLRIDSPHVMGPGLASLKNARKLRYVALLNTAIGDDSIAFLADIPSIEVIKIYKSRSIKGSGLAALKKSRSLAVLGLVGLPIADDAVDHIAAIPSLEQVDLCDTNITQDGVLKLVNGSRRISVDLYGRTNCEPEVIDKVVPKDPISPIRFMGDTYYIGF